MHTSERTKKTWGEARGVFASVVVFAVETMISTLPPVITALVTSCCFVFIALWLYWKPTRMTACIIALAAFAIGGLTYYANSKDQSEKRLIEQRAKKVENSLLAINSKLAAVEKLQKPNTLIGDFFVSRYDLFGADDNPFAYSKFIKNNGWNYTVSEVSPRNFGVKIENRTNFDFKSAHCEYNLHQIKIDSSVPTLYKTGNLSCNHEKLIELNPSISNIPPNASSIISAFSYIDGKIKKRIDQENYLGTVFSNYPSGDLRSFDLSGTIIRKNSPLIVSLSLTDERGTKIIIPFFFGVLQIGGSGLFYTDSQDGSVQVDGGARLLNHRLIKPLAHRLKIDEGALLAILTEFLTPQALRSNLEETQR